MISYYNTFRNLRMSNYQFSLLSKTPPKKHGAFLIYVMCTFYFYALPKNMGHSLH